MGFTSGFEKTAPVAPIIGAVRGATAKATKAVTEGAKRFVTGQKAKGVASYRKASGMGSGKAPGEGMAAGRARRAQKAGKSFTPGQNDAREAKAKTDVFTRKAKMDNAKAAQKPSFARKHPLLTAGGLYLGARASGLIGGDDKQQTAQQPQVMPGQY